ncbi:MAG TPA: lipopolysaccharide transport periplasmic protein LptA [Steroidobacteraceae bacterium]|jgi:lipopolysaccharide transport protein LptA|nr:lipopolysaccharide transport periplasmic protein LptA [Steroidobacteraceae bacterium]
MANSHPVKRFARTTTACLAGLLGVAAAAQSPRETQKIVVDAVPVDVNYRDNTALLKDVVITQGDMRIEAAEARVKGGLDFENGEWTISGNVRINAEGGKLLADKAVISFRNNLISRATITGTPAEFEQMRKDSTTYKGRAPTIDYQTASGTVSFRDNAWLSDGCNEITGKQLVYNIKEQRVQGQPNGLPSATPTGGGRVRFVIQPNAKSGDKPCTSPEKKP